MSTARVGLQDHPEGTLSRVDPGRVGDKMGIPGREQQWWGEGCWTVSEMVEVWGVLAGAGLG